MELRQELGCKTVTTIMTSQENIFYISPNFLYKYLNNFFKLSNNRKKNEEVINQILKEHYYDLNKEIDKQFDSFLLAYDCFNFLIPNYFENDEDFKDIKQQYLDKLSKKPFYLKENDKNIAFDLYYRCKNYFEQPDYVVENATLMPNSEYVKKEEKLEISKARKSELKQRIKKSNDQLDKKLRTNDMNHFRSLQLEVLTFGIKLPALLNITGDEFKRSKYLMYESSYYGEYEMPISKYFEEETKKRLKENISNYLD